jgi:hypothetical protein
MMMIDVGCPDYLRGNEYVYRNANNLRLVDFQKLLTDHLYELVASGVMVNVVLDTTKVPNENSGDAVMVITSVRPVKQTGSHMFDIASPNQSKHFQYSVPFTREGGVHARSIELQWKRTTSLEVEDPFPCMSSRQLVLRRSIRELTPIENAIDDITLRLGTMLVELGRNKKDGADTNNLMRIVQGSVMPQVNGGAAEVARMFLGGASIFTEAHMQLEV